MAVTFGIAAVVNDFGDHIGWNTAGTTVDTGQIEDARQTWYVLQDGVVQDFNHTGPCFGIIADDASGTWERVHQVLEMGAGSLTTSTAGFTPAPVAPERTYHVGTGGDGTTGLSPSTAFSTLAAAKSAMLAWAGSTERHVAVAVKAGETHDLSGSLASIGDVHGRVVLTRYGTGDDPVVDLLSNDEVFAMGTFGTGDQLRGAIKHVSFIGNGNTAALTTLIYDGTVSDLRNFSFVYDGVHVDDGGGLLTMASFSTSEDNWLDGDNDFLAIRNCSATDHHAYGLYGGARHLLIDNFDCADLTDSGDAGIRSYMSGFGFVRGYKVHGHAGPGMRWLSGSSAWSAEGAHTQWMNFCDTWGWNGLFVFQNDDADGGGDTGQRNMHNMYVHGGRFAPGSGSGGACLIQGFDRVGFKLRHCWWRGSFDLQANNPGNDHVSRAFFECNTLVNEAVGSGGTVGMRAQPTDLSIHVRNNFAYIVMTSGTGHLHGGPGSLSRSTLASSDRNILLSSGTVDWYSGWDGGAVSLATWQGYDGNARDQNSAHTSGTTHGLAGLGTANGGTGSVAPDQDLVPTGSSFPGWQIGEVRPGSDVDMPGFITSSAPTAPHAGAISGSSTAPTAPGGGGGSPAFLVILHHRRAQESA